MLVIPTFRKTSRHAGFSSYSIRTHHRRQVVNLVEYYHLDLASGKGHRPVRNQHLKHALFRGVDRENPEVKNLSHLLKYVRVLELLFPYDYLKPNFSLLG